MSSGRPEGRPTVVCSSLLRLLLKKKVSCLFQSHQNAPVTFTDHNERFPTPPPPSHTLQSISEITGSPSSKYSRTSITSTRITRIPRQLELNFLSLEKNFTEIYPDNSNSPLTRTVFRCSSLFELPGFYCISIDEHRDLYGEKTYRFRNLRK